MKKINIGVLLTILVLLLLAIYCVYHYDERKKEQEEIEKLCQSYITFQDSVLSFGDKGTYPLNITDEEYQTRLSNIYHSLPFYMTDEQAYIERQYEIIKTILDRQYKEKKCSVISLSSHIVSIDQITFSGKEASMQVKVNVNISYQDERGITKESQTVIDKLEWIKKDTWKLKHAALKYHALLDDKDLIVYFM